MFAAQENPGHSSAFEVWEYECTRDHVTTVTDATTGSLVYLLRGAMAGTGCEVCPVPCPDAYLATGGTHVHAVAA